MLNRNELESLQIEAQKDSAFGDGTTRVDSGSLAIIIDEVLTLRELVKYSEDIANDKQTAFRLS